MKGSDRLQRLLVLLVCCVVAAGLTAAGAGAESAGSHEHGAWKEKRGAATTGADGIQRVEIVGGEYYYDPNYIVVKVNRPVEMKLRKAGGFIPHDLVVKAPEAGIDIRIEMKDEPQIVRFTPTRVGKYPCTATRASSGSKPTGKKGWRG